MFNHAPVTRDSKPPREAPAPSRAGRAGRSLRSRSTARPSRFVARDSRPRQPPLLVALRDRNPVCVSTRPGRPCYSGRVRSPAASLAPARRFSPAHGRAFRSVASRGGKPPAVDLSEAPLVKQAVRRSQLAFLQTPPTKMATNA